MSSDEEDVNDPNNEEYEEEANASGSLNHTPNNNIQSRIVITNEGLLDQSVLPKTEGFMYKKGGAVNARGGFRNWKKRWFVIQSVDFMESESFELKYYDRPGGTLKGSVSLHDIEVFIDEDSAKGKHVNKAIKYEFHLLLQNGSVLQLSCDNEDERGEWMVSLEIIIMYLHKKHTSQLVNLNGYNPFADDDAENYQLGHDLAANCVAYGPGLFGAEAGKRTYFYIQLNDLFGQPVSIGNIPISATVTNGTHLYYLDLKDHQDGKYSGSYTLSQAGEYQLNILLNDEHHISQSPFHLTILPAKTVAKFCFSEGSVLSKLPVPTSPTTPPFCGSFTIQAMDGYGNAKKHGGDPFEIGVLGSAQLVDLTDHEDGKYTVTLQSLYPPTSGQGLVGTGVGGGVSIMVSLYGKPIASSPFVPQLVPFHPPQENSTRNAQPSNAEDMSSSTRSSKRPPPPRTLNEPSPVLPTATAATTAPPAVSARGASAAASSPAPPQGALTASAKGLPKGPNSGGVLEESRQRALQAKLLQQPQQPQQPQLPDGLQGSATQTPGRYSSTLQHPHSQNNKSGKQPLNAFGSSVVKDENPAGKLQSAPVPPAPRTAPNPTNTISPVANPSATNISNNTAAPSSRLSKLSQLAQRSAATLQTMKQQQQQHHTNPSPANVITSSSHYPSPSGLADGQYRKIQHQEDTYRCVVQGLYPFNLPQQVSNSHNDPHLAYVQQLSPSDYALFEQLHGVCVSGLQQSGVQGGLACHPVISHLLYDEYDVLYSVFCFFADKHYGQLGLPFLPVSDAQQSSAGGFVRLFELYDLVPYFVTKQQVKILFTMLLLTQRHRPSPMTGGQQSSPNNALDYASFLQAVVGIALLIFSAPTEQQSLSLEEKVKMVLRKWGLGDAQKLQQIRSQSNNQSSSGPLYASDL